MYKLSALQSRLIAVVRQAQMDEFLQFSEILKFYKLISNVHLGCMYGFVVLITSYQYIYVQYFEQMPLYIGFYILNTVLESHGEKFISVHSNLSHFVAFDLSPIF